MWNKIERVLASLMAIAAIVVAGVLVHREFNPRPATVNLASDAPPPKFISGWEQFAVNGIELGANSGKVRIIEFADLECPFCKQFQLSTLAAVTAKFPNDISVTFMHMPLSMHRFALPAARAAECARRQDRALALIDATYRKQDSLGLKSWVSYGAEAGIRDSPAFAHCIASTEAVPRIDSGMAIARRIGVHATPTVMVNGWLFSHPLDEKTLTTMIEEIRKGKAPKDVVAASVK